MNVRRVDLCPEETNPAADEYVIDPCEPTQPAVLPFLAPDAFGIPRVTRLPAPGRWKGRP